jgi:hypothetical protein
MAIVANRSPGAVLTGYFVAGAPTLRAEIAAFTERVDALLRGGAIRAFVAARRREGDGLLVEVFGATPGTAGAHTAAAMLDGRAAVGERPADALDGEIADADWGAAAAAVDA